MWVLRCLRYESWGGIQRWNGKYHNNRAIVKGVRMVTLHRVGMYQHKLTRKKEKFWFLNRDRTDEKAQVQVQRHAIKNPIHSYYEDSWISICLFQIHSICSPCMSSYYNYSLKRFWKDLLVGQIYGSKFNAYNFFFSWNLYDLTISIGGCIFHCSTP